MFLLNHVLHFRPPFGGCVDVSAQGTVGLSVDTPDGSQQVQRLSDALTLRVLIGEVCHRGSQSLLALIIQASLDIHLCQRTESLQALALRLAVSVILQEKNDAVVEEDGDRRFSDVRLLVQQLRLDGLVDLACSLLQHELCRHVLHHVADAAQCQHHCWVG